MALEHGIDSTGRYPWAQIDFRWRGDSYLIRLTAIPPYRELPSNLLNGHIDFWNVTEGIAGRYPNIKINAPNTGIGETRRHPTIRDLKALVGSVTPVPSPVFPLP